LEGRPRATFLRREILVPALFDRVSGKNRGCLGGRRFALIGRRGAGLVGRQQKRWIGSESDGLNKRGDRYKRDETIHRPYPTEFRAESRARHWFRRSRRSGSASFRSSPAGLEE